MLIIRILIIRIDFESPKLSRLVLILYDIGDSGRKKNTLEESV